MKLHTAAQAAAAAVVATRLARGRHRRPPLRAGAPLPAGTTVSAVIPARDEAARIGPCVLAARADPGVSEVLVVDDESTDGTAAVAARAGARVIPGRPLPGGWVGKQWALQQGLEVASGEYVLTLDADTRPRPGLAAALVTAAIGGPFDLVSAGPRFVCDSAAEQGLHAAMLATLVYRFGPMASPHPAPHRVVVNGQCLLARRAGLAAAGGFAPVRGYLTDDIALARNLARRGWRIGFLDGRDLLDVDMHASMTEVWREWGRSLPMADVTSPAGLAADLAVLGLTTALPLARLAAGRPTALDLGLLALRVSLLVPLRGLRVAGPGHPGDELAAYRNCRVQLGQHPDATEPDPVDQQVLRRQVQLEPDREVGPRGSLTRPNCSRIHSPVEPELVGSRPARRTATGSPAAARASMSSSAVTKPSSRSPSSTASASPSIAMASSCPIAGGQPLRQPGDGAEVEHARAGRRAAPGSCRGAGRRAAARPGPGPANRKRT